MKLSGLAVLSLVLLASSSLSANTVYFPQVVFAGNYSTTFVIWNTGSTPASGQLSFYHQGGNVGVVQNIADQLKAAAAILEAAAGSDSKFASIATLAKIVADRVNTDTAALDSIHNQSQILKGEILSAGEANDGQRQQLARLNQELNTVLLDVLTLMSQVNPALQQARQSGLRIPLEAVTSPQCAATFNIAPGGSKRVTCPASGTLTVGWAQITTNTGTVQGTAIVDLRESTGALITTATVPGSETGSAFVVPVEATPSLATGIAIANVTTNPLNARLRLLNDSGSEIATVNDARLTVLDSQQQVADLVTSFFPQIKGTNFNGTVVVETSTGASNSLAVAALTVNTTALSPLPVKAADSQSASALYFPQVVAGDGFSTDFVLINDGPRSISSRLNFYDQSGSTRTEFSRDVTVPGGGSARFTLSTSARSVSAGWGILRTDGGSVKAMAVVNLRAGNGLLLASSAVPGVEAGGSFFLPVDVTATASTSIAIANASDTGPLTGNLRLLKEDGSQAAAATDVRLKSIGAHQQVADFVTMFFPDLAQRTFKGMLVVEATTDAVSRSFVATAFRMKLRGSLSDTAIPALTALSRELTVNERKIIDAVNAFSLALWSKINAGQVGQNVFVSPLSASFALAMTMNGAANRTAEEMRSALQLSSMSDVEINEGYRSLMGLLSGLDPTVDMNIANAIWYDRVFPFFQSFLDAAKQYFDAEVKGLNFHDVQSVLDAVNAWADAKTNHKIPTILSSNDLTADAIMVLSNAIYFKGGWRDKFDAAETRTAAFHATARDETMSLMHRHGKIAYMETSDFQAVDLPYGDSAFSMAVILPKAGKDIETLATSFTPATWQSLTLAFKDEDVDLSLPKFSLSYARKLNDDLKSLGMISAFAPGGADFTRISPQGKQLYIDLVKQKAFVNVDEEGTEAAAVTVVVVNTVCVCQPEPKIIHVDHPFIFLIRERLSGTLLFLGKIDRIPSV